MKAGTIFHFTTGEYSDFGIFASLRALEDFDLDVTLKAWITTGGAVDEDGYSIGHQAFVDKLLEMKLVEEVVVPRLDLGSYGRFENTPEADAHPKTDKASAWIRGCLTHADCKSHPELGAACAAKQEPPSNGEETTR